MKPSQSLAVDRRSFFGTGMWAGVALLVVPVAGGCLTQAVTAPLPEPAAIADLGNEIKLVGEIANVSGLQFVKVEAIALVTGLAQTGSDPPPNPQRAMLTADMQARGVQGINDVLASPATSLVICRAYLPPGVRKGDRLDVEVLVPQRSETSSLRGGWLMPTRLEEVAVLGGDVHRGRVLAHCQGPVLIDSIVAGEDDPTRLVHGRVPGGVISVHERNLGLVLHSDYQSVQVSSRVGAAVNNRFYINDRGGKRGVATPKRDNYLDLTVHPRYRNNLLRFVRVVSGIAVGESAGERAERLQLLEKELLNPISAASAAIRLEAIGNDAIESLARALTSPDTEVRFYAAEALAYLGDRRAIAPLAEYAKNRPPFRWHALAALSVMDAAEDMTAYDALNDLLHVPSAETRYGAFRALTAMNPNDPLVKGERMGQEFSYHVIETSAEPMIHFSRTRQPELVVFGGRQQLRCPFAFAGKMVIKGSDTGRVRISRFEAGKPDRQEECGATLDEVIRCIVRLDGNYGDVYDFLQEAKAKEVLVARLVVDALPRPDRTYHRVAGGETSAETTTTGEVGDDGENGVEPQRAASPKPGLFFGPETNDDEDRNHRRGPLPLPPGANGEELGEEGEAAEESPSEAESTEPASGILDRIFPWFGGS